MLFTGLVLVSCFPILDLGLQRRGRDAGRVLEHQVATKHAGPGETEEAYDAQGAGQRELLRPAFGSAAASSI